MEKNKTVLVTGATGFIGKRLIYQLLDDGCTVYALSRIRGVGLGPLEHKRLHLLFGDLNDPTKMDPLPENIEAAFYLIHSMAEKVENLMAKEETTANNFIDLLKKTQCKQIIYLGGIIEEGALLSDHLRSRVNVEKVLKRAPCPLTILRASIIIGSGSASFEIIRDLVEKLPLMVAPKWVHSRCQPIAIYDVIYYLSKCLLNPLVYGATFDIGGPEVMSFKQVLMRYAKFRGLKRLIIDVPVLSPRLSSYWLVFITSVRFSLCSYLVESMKCNSYCQNHAIEQVLPHVCLSFEEALGRAFEKIAQNEVTSTWMDSWLVSEVNADITKFIEVPSDGCLIDEQKLHITIPKAVVIERIWSLGGKKGWHGLQWAWYLRGLIDKCMGGTGLNRGRRHPTEIAVGDSIDFWRVVKADKNLGHLILFAEMKLPGEAWLEFHIDKDILIQKAVFRPKGILGRIYWYMMLPFHFFIFKKMAKNLAQKLEIR